MSFLVHAGGEVVTEQDVFDIPVPQFKLDQISELAQFIIDTFLKT